jgi:hypothetical protein
MTDDHGAEVWVSKDGRAWRIGREADVAWIRENTVVSFAITSAIPPVFEAYATLELPGSGDHDARSPLEDPDRHDAGGVFSALPSELTILGANGSTLYTENLQAKATEAAQFCEGYAEP